MSFLRVSPPPPPDENKKRTARRVGKQIADTEWPSAEQIEQTDRRKR
ncbi:unnamed protein product, partial [Ixodes persulcatus]